MQVSDIVINIYTPDKDVGCLINIHRIEGTNNFEFKGDFPDSESSVDGVLHNYEGSYLEVAHEVVRILVAT